MTKTVLHRSINVTTRHRIHAINRVALGSMAAVVILTGCSATSGGPEPSSTRSDGVASVADPARSSATSEGSSTSDSRSGKAPQIRLDTTDTEELHMWQPYLQCAKDHHVPVDTAGSELKSSSGGSVTNPEPGLLWYLSADIGEYPDAEKACSELRPLFPPELDPKQNPHFMDDFRAQMDCMKEHGLEVDPNPDGSGWRLRKDAAGANQIARDCQVQAFGGK